MDVSCVNVLVAAGAGVLRESAEPCAGEVYEMRLHFVDDGVGATCNVARAWLRAGRRRLRLV